MDYRVGEFFVKVTEVDYANWVVGCTDNYRAQCQTGACRAIVYGATIENALEWFRSEHAHKNN